MTELVTEAAELQTFLEREGFEFFFLGGLVVQVWGRNRLTDDIDLTLGGLSDISEPLHRSTYQKFTNDISLKVCSAEDLIIFKTFAARPQDWIDVETVIIRQSELDWDYIDSAIEQVSVYDDMDAKLKRLHELKAEFYQK